MPRDVMNKTLAELILDSGYQNMEAALFKDKQALPFGIQSVTLSLNTARDIGNPYKILFPHKSFYVVSATDVSTTVNYLPTTENSFQSALPIKQNDVWTSDRLISQGFLTWSAQTGKSITIVFFVESEFKSGSQISVTGGGVSLVDGSALVQSNPTLSAATITQILTSDTSRKVSFIQNLTGASIWVGGSAVSNTGSNRGLEITNNAVFEWRATAALYAYSVAGGSLHLSNLS